MCASASCLLHILLCVMSFPSQNSCTLSVFVIEWIFKKSEFSRRFNVVFRNKVEEIFLILEKNISVDITQLYLWNDDKEKYASIDSTCLKCIFPRKRRRSLYSLKEWKLPRKPSLLLISSLSHLRLFSVHPQSLHIITFLRLSLERSVQRSHPNISFDTYALIETKIKKREKKNWKEENQHYP